MDITVQTLKSKPQHLLKTPQTEAVLTGPATNESGATPKPAVSVLVAKDTMCSCLAPFTLELSPPSLSHFSLFL